MISFRECILKTNLQSRWVQKVTLPLLLSTQVPTGQNLIRMVRGCTLIGPNLLKVPSEDSESDKEYIVDTVLGKCECMVGSNGAPCKHQYVVWASLKKANPNFMPFFCKEDRMKFGEIAIGNAVREDDALFDELRISTDEQIIALEEMNNIDLLNLDLNGRFVLD